MTHALINANFPITGEGRTMHLGTSAADINPRILSVGAPDRGKLVAEMLDDCRAVSSRRGFITYSGLFQDVPVSVIVTGMGIPMMDFMVREASYGQVGKIAIIRLGTCGILLPKVKAGSIIVAKSSRMVQQNYTHNEGGKPYMLSAKVDADSNLHHLLKSNLCHSLGSDNIGEGVDLTCETFYNCQGRIDSRFDDNNESLIEEMIEKEPEAAAMEMETFKLFHLASCSRNKISAAACMIGLLNRQTQELMDFSTLPRLENISARAALTALIQFPLDN